MPTVALVARRRQTDLAAAAAAAAPSARRTREQATALAGPSCSAAAAGSPKMAIASQTAVAQRRCQNKRCTMVGGHAALHKNGASAGME